MMPETMAIDMRVQGMLCISGEMGGEATEPGLAPEMDEMDVNLGEELDLG